MKMTNDDVVQQKMRKDLKLWYSNHTSIIPLNIYNLQSIACVPPKSVVQKKLEDRSQKKKDNVFA